MKVDNYDIMDQNSKHLFILGSKLPTSPHTISKIIITQINGSIVT